eukprot:9502039-Pyramimonas_sp.AAC.2
MIDRVVCARSPSTDHPCGSRTDPPSYIPEGPTAARGRPGRVAAALPRSPSPASQQGPAPPYCHPPTGHRPSQPSIVHAADANLRPHDMCRPLTSC